YPVYTKFPYNLAIAGSESGTVESLHRLLNSAFNVANRVLIMTPWGNFVVFKMPTNLHDRHAFYLFDGCTCNVDRFRHLDLSYGTAGLLPFRCQSDVVCYMIDSRELR
ncbi:CG12470, partial [Drosophila busckii]